MSDPVRLLDSAVPGLELDILRSAATEAPPEELRGHLLRAIAGALSGTAAVAGLAAGASAAGASATAASGAEGAATLSAAGAGANAAGAGGLGTSAGAGSAVASGSVVGGSVVGGSVITGSALGTSALQGAVGALAKLTLLLEAAGAAKLGIALATSVAVAGGAITLARQTPPPLPPEAVAPAFVLGDVGAGRSGSALSARNITPSPSERWMPSEPPVPSPAGSAISGSVVLESEGAAPSAAIESDAIESGVPSPPRTRPAARASANPRQRATGDDVLRQQLDIVSQARRNLHDHEPNEALRRLDEYELRFAQGLLGPEVQLLRQQAREQLQELAGKPPSPPAALRGTRAPSTVARPLVLDQSSPWRRRGDAPGAPR